MPSAEQKKALWSLGMFIMPVIIVKVAGTLLGGTGPGHVDAAVPTPIDLATTPVAAPVVGPKKWSERQLAAASHVERLSAEAFGASPLYYEPVTESAVIHETAPVQRDVPAFVLNAVVTSARSAKAVINGRPYLIGESVGDTGWTVQAIDSETRSASLKAPDGERTLTIAVKLPM